MSEKLKVGILGGTGMVGQRFISLLENHPWFEEMCIRDRFYVSYNNCYIGDVLWLDFGLYVARWQ